MYIIYFLVSFGSLLAAVFGSVSTGAVVVLILMSLLFLVVATWMLLNARIENQRRSERQMISYDELRHFRELAEQNKAEKKTDS